MPTLIELDSFDEMKVDRISPDDAFALRKGGARNVQPQQVVTEETSRAILDLLRGGERTAGEVVERMGAPQPAVSKQLKALRESGLVRVRKEAQRRWYALAPEGLEAVEAWLASYREFWDGRLDALERHLDTES